MAVPSPSIFLWTKDEIDHDMCLDFDDSTNFKVRAMIVNKKKEKKEREGEKKHEDIDYHSKNLHLTKEYILIEVNCNVAEIINISVDGNKSGNHWVSGREGA